MDEEKIRKKRTALIGKKYPEFNPLNYNQSMRTSLRWYNLEEEDDAKRAYAILYWEKKGKDVKGLARLNTGYFATVGAVAHMTYSRGIVLEDKHYTYLDNKYKELAAYVPDEQEKVEVVKREPTDVTPELIGEIEGALDEWKNGFDTKGFLARNEIKPAQANKIAAWFKKRVEEMSAIAGDKYLEEAYSNFSKRDLKKYIELVQEIVDTCSSYSKATRARSTRKVKAKPPSVLVKNIVLVKEVPELKLKGISAEKIVGATEAWFFDTEKRRLVKYTAQIGTKLTVKGKAIQNFDPDTSGSKILRKPVEQLTGVADWTKRPANAIMNGIKATFTKVSGRVNDKLILIGAF